MELGKIKVGNVTMSNHISMNKYSLTDESLRIFNVTCRSTARYNPSASKEKNAHQPSPASYPVYIVFNTFHAVQCDDPALPQIDNRKGPLSGIAADDHLIVTHR